MVLALCYVGRLASVGAWPVSQRIVTVAMGMQDQKDHNSIQSCCSVTLFTTYHPTVCHLKDGSPSLALRSVDIEKRYTDLPSVKYLPYGMIDFLESENMNSSYQSSFTK